MQIKDILGIIKFWIFSEQGKGYLSFYVSFYCHIFFSHEVVLEASRYGLLSISALCRVLFLVVVKLESHCWSLRLL